MFESLDVRVCQSSEIVAFFMRGPRSTRVLDVGNSVPAIINPPHSSFSLTETASRSRACKILGWKWPLLGYQSVDIYVQWHFFLAGPGINFNLPKRDDLPSRHRLYSESLISAPGCC